MSAEVRVKHFLHAHARWDGYSEFLLHAMALSYLLTPAEKKATHDTAGPRYRWARGLAVENAWALSRAHLDRIAEREAAGVGQ